MQLQRSCRVSRSVHDSRRWRASLLIAVALIGTVLMGSVKALAQNVDRSANAARLDPFSWRGDALTLANLGHATLLMNYFGVRVISDPSLFEHVGLALGPLFTVGPERHTAPPLSPAELQSVDVILITHAHMDHLDIPSLKTMPKRAVVVACDRCSRLIAPLGFTDVRELKWGEHTEIDGLTITAMGAKHWGRRWPWSTDYGFNSYVLEKDGHRMLLACDSAYTSLFAGIRNNPPELAAFSIGAYDPWIWNHANPEQVWSMFLQTGARYLVPIHWGTFRLSREPMDQPLQRLIAAAGADAGRIVMRQIGAAWTMPPQPATQLHAASAPPPPAP